MFFDEVNPKGAVAAPVICGKVDAVRFRIAHLAENFAKGLFVPWLAVHDDSVHVENDGLNPFHAGATEHKSSKMQGVDAAIERHAVDGKIWLVPRPGLSLI